MVNSNKTENVTSNICKTCDPLKRKKNKRNKRKLQAECLQQRNCSKSTLCNKVMQQNINNNKLNNKLNNKYKVCDPEYNCTNKSNNNYILTKIINYFNNINIIDDFIKELKVLFNILLFKYSDKYFQYKMNKMNKNNNQQGGSKKVKFKYFGSVFISNISLIISIILYIIYKKVYILLIIISIILIILYYNHISINILSIIYWGILAIIILLILYYFIQLYKIIINCIKNNNASLEDNTIKDTIKKSILSYNDIDNKQIIINIISIIILVVSIRTLCNFTPWISTDMHIYFVSLILFIVLIIIIYSSDKDYSNSLTDVSKGFFIMSSFNAMYQIIIRKDPTKAVSKLRDLSKFVNNIESKLNQN